MDFKLSQQWEILVGFSSTHVLLSDLYKKLGSKTLGRSLGGRMVGRRMGRLVGLILAVLLPPPVVFADGKQ